MAAVTCLGCAGFFGGGEVHLAPPTADSCGSWTANATVDPTWRARELVVYVDGAPTGTVRVPARATLVEVGSFVGAEREVEVHVALGKEVSEHFPIRTPPWEVALSATTPAKPFPALEVPPLPVEVLSPCPVAGRLTLSASLLPDDTPLLLKAAIPPENRVEVPLPSLPQGSYRMRTALYEGTRQVAERTVAIEVGPPCVDDDGDGYQACDDDCDDKRADVHPGVEDVVGDGIDNDCDGVNGRDADRDGQESAEVGGRDCNDDDPLVWAGNPDPPDRDGDRAYAWESLDYDCDGEEVARPGPWDCDDGDPEIPRPELAEPNGIDDDCDGLVDEGTVAFDDDGDGYRELDGDCNDADQTVHPGAGEVGDCKDNDCDGTVDEGVQRPERDDAYEPNDTSPYTLSAARPKKSFLGLTGGHKPTRERLLLTTRDATDVETFAIWTHDGALDTWHVTAEIESMGDGRSYEIVIKGNGRTASGVVSSPGGEVRMGEDTFQSNTGTYTIEVHPREGELDYCPLVLEVRSG